MEVENAVSMSHCLYKSWFSSIHFTIRRSLLMIHWTWTIMLESLPSDINTLE